jgi:hypothetical protein
MADSFPVSPPIEEDVLSTSRTGWELLADRLLNKGTAFTESERDVFGLHGLLPPHVGTLDEQAARRMAVLRRFVSDLERYAFLRELHDNNETLFFAVLDRGCRGAGRGGAGGNRSDRQSAAAGHRAARNRVRRGSGDGSVGAPRRADLRDRDPRDQGRDRAKMWLPRSCRYQPAR